MHVVMDMLISVFGGNYFTLCVYIFISKCKIVHLKCLQFCQLYFSKAGWAGGRKEKQFLSLPVCQ